MSKVRDFAEIISAGITASDAGLGNVTNESKATMFISPTFTGTPVAPVMKLTPTATVSAPTGAQAVKGAIYYDSDEETLMQHDGTSWARIYTPPASATGGTESTYGAYKVHTFLADGNFTVSNGSLTVDYLVVGGGGGTHGSASGTGGGGAGGFRTGTGFVVTSQTYSITVGAGGALDTNGDDSIFSTITSAGGGRGGVGRGGAGSAGGSGGGGTSADPGAPGGGAGNTPSTSPSQGNAGGAAASAWGYTSGGGGGAGEAGNTDTAPSGGSAGSGGADGQGGSGGDGTANSYRTGSAVTYAGGGGGGTYAGTAGSGGDGGGGGGNTTGLPNTGGGGGGKNGNGSAGLGGSGIVIIRYAV